MFDSKSPIVKYVGYVVIGFFALIIIISFGMPDFISRLNLDKSTVAVVNGEKVHRLDFLRYRDNRFRNMQSEKMEPMILNYYINDILLLQEAEKLGFNVTDEKLKDFLRNIPAFQDPKTGKFDPDSFKSYLDRSRISFKDFYKIIKKDLIREEMVKAIRAGIAVASSEAAEEYICNNSKIQIKYAHVSNKDLKERYKNEIQVSDAEITKEMGKNKKEIKDPKSDRKRIKTKIENRKLEKRKNDLIKRINEIALRKGSFNEAAALMQGKVAMSQIAKLGEPLKDTSKQGAPLYGISNSKIFQEEFSSTKEGTSSRAITSATGIYIYTPVIKNIKTDIPTEKEQADIIKNLENENLRVVINTMMQKTHEKSKIVKNLKTN